jgi:HAMP domain-containing protein
VLIWLTVNRSLQPLTRLAAEISQRDPTYLTPVKHNNIPLEIKSLVDALNQLFQRLSHAFDNERRFTADAAHELRTPLAGIKIQATVAKRSRDDSQRQQALDNINAGIDRTTHLVELDNKAYCFALKTTAWALNPNNAKRCWNASAEAHTNTSAAAAWVCRLCNALFNCINAN